MQEQKKLKVLTEEFAKRLSRVNGLTRELRALGCRVIAIRVRGIMPTLTLDPDTVPGSLPSDALVNMERVGQQLHCHVLLNGCMVKWTSSIH